MTGSHSENRLALKTAMRRVRPRRQGSVFILTLWALVFLAALALAVGAHVSANLRLAAEMSARTRHQCLARAGVETAVYQVTANSTNWDGVADEDLGSDEDLFKDVPLEHGTFTVYYTYVSTNSGATVTNYGLLCEARHVNVNRILSSATRERLASLIEDKAGQTSVTASEITEGIKDYWVQKKDMMLTDGVKISYKGVIQSVHELLLVDALHERPWLLPRIAPFLTLYDADCFSGTAVGRATTAGGERRIDFVCDRKGTVLYWYEY